MLAATAARGRARRCRCSSSTTWAGPTAGATSTTSRRGSPRSSASPTARRACARARPRLLPERRDEPRPRQRRARGRPPQRGDDRARRLHGRARPAAARRRAAPLLRPGHRGRGAARSPQHPDARRAARPLREPRGPARAWSSWPSASASTRPIFGQAWIRTLEQQIDRGAGRYLAVVKAALLDEHYLENEVRLEYLGRPGAGTAPDPTALRDPARTLPVRYQRLAQAREAGRPLDARRQPSPTFPYTDMGRAQLDHLEARCRERRSRGRVPGDLAEVGVGRGGGGDLPAGFLDAHEVADRTVWVVDRVPRHARTERADAGARAPVGADLNQVRDGFDRFGLLDDRVRFLQGAADDALADAPIEPLALLRLGEGLGDRRSAPCSTPLHPRLSPGGVVIVAGTADPGVEAAVVERPAPRSGIDAPLERVDWNAVTWRVPTPPPAAGAAEQPSPRVARHRPPHRRPIDLTVVVVFYNMRREARRTLQSLVPRLPAGHRGPRLRGHRRRQRLRRRPAAHAPSSCAASAPSSASSTWATTPTRRPTVALNRGHRRRRAASTLALMIDGAHVLTPGVLRHGMTGPRAPTSRRSSPPSSGTSGPASRATPSRRATTRTAEDRLFQPDPLARRRLPAVRDRPLHRRARLVRRHRREQLPLRAPEAPRAGRRVRRQLLDARRRLRQPRALRAARAAHPGVNAASILGEGTFHQFHGGTTTNVADEAERREPRRRPTASTSRSCGAGPSSGSTRPVHYVGVDGHQAARRTRSRRRVRASLRRRSATRSTTTDADAGCRCADELKLAAIEASGTARRGADATWLGHPVNRFPTDLHAYQELHRRRSARRRACSSATTTGSAAGPCSRRRSCDQLGPRTGRRGRPRDAGDDRPDPPADHPRRRARAEDAEVAGRGGRARRPSDRRPGVPRPGRGSRGSSAAFEHYAPLVAGRWLRRGREHRGQRAARSRRLRARAPTRRWSGILGGTATSWPTRPRALHGHVQPQRLPAARRTSRVSDDRAAYFFVHLQKTGGTALFRRLRHHFGVDAVYPTPEDQGVPERPSTSTSSPSASRGHRDQIRVVTGHFPLCAAELLGVAVHDLHRPAGAGRAHAVVPAPPAGGGAAVRRALSLEELYDDPVVRAARPQPHGEDAVPDGRRDDDGALTQVAVDEERLERAVANLTDRVDVIGVQERFDEFCAALEASLRVGPGSAPLRQPLRARPGVARRCGSGSRPTTRWTSASTSGRAPRWPEPRSPDERDLALGVVGRGEEPRLDGVAGSGHRRVEGRAVQERSSKSMASPAWNCGRTTGASARRRPPPVGAHRPVEDGAAGAGLQHGVEAAGDEVHPGRVDAAVGERDPDVEGPDPRTEEGAVLVPVGVPSSGTRRSVHLLAESTGRSPR